MKRVFTRCIPADLSTPENLVETTKYGKIMYTEINVCLNDDALWDLLKVLCYSPVPYFTPV